MASVSLAAAALFVHASFAEAAVDPKSAADDYAADLGAQLFGLSCQTFSYQSAALSGSDLVITGLRVVSAIAVVDVSSVTIQDPIERVPRGFVTASVIWGSGVWTHGIGIPRFSAAFRAAQLENGHIRSLVERKAAPLVSSYDQMAISGIGIAAPGMDAEIGIANLTIDYDNAKDGKRFGSRLAADHVDFPAALFGNPAILGVIGFPDGFVGHFGAPMSYNSADNIFCFDELFALDRLGETHLRYQSWWHILGSHNGPEAAAGGKGQRGHGERLSPIGDDAP